MTEVAAQAGDVRIALDALERAASTGLADLSWLDRCRLLAPLRDEPRFTDVRAEIARRADGIMGALWG